MAKKERKIKRYAEINGRPWRASGPLCSGCPELAISSECLYEGNGCRYPEMRILRPSDFYGGYIALKNKTGLKDEEIRELEIEYFKEATND